VIAVSDPIKGKAQKLVEKLKLDAKSYENNEDVISIKDVDIIYIAMHNEMHYPLIKKALNSGKKVFCEKPICINARQTKEMIELAKQKKLFLMEGFWSR
jgi:dihydrodiol dehydrogenase / D-xylose 1-dehydrogenase (NADP)